MAFLMNAQRHTSMAPAKLVGAGNRKTNEGETGAVTVDMLAGNTPAADVAAGNKAVNADEKKADTADVPAGNHARRIRECRSQDGIPRHTSMAQQHAAAEWCL